MEIDAWLFADECHAAVSRHAMAEGAYRTALERSESLGAVRQMAESHYRIARTLMSLNRYETAVERYLDAARHAEAAGDPEFAAVVTDHLGMAHFVLRNYGKAMDLCRRAEAVLERSADRALHAENLQHIGIIYTGSNQWREALDYFQRVLALRESLGDRVALIGALGNVALAQNGLARYGDALASLDRALALGTGSEDPRVGAFLLVRRARVLRAVGRFDEASRDFDRALAIDRTLGNKRRLASTLTAIADFYRDRPGHETRVIAALDEAMTLNQSVYDEESTARINELQERYDAESRQRQIDLLERDKAIRALEARQQRLVQTGTGVTSLLAIAGLAFVVVRYRAEAKTSRELREALQNIRTLQGLLPICAHCKKIRDDEGYWQQVESYIGQRSEARFSHGICPECAGQFYPDVFGSPNTPEPTQ